VQQFTYRAKDKAGNTVSGVVESVNAQQAVKTLQEHGLLVISVAEKRDFSLKALSPRLASVSEQEVATFTRLLSTMLRAGLPLVDALYNLSVQTRNVTFKEAIKAMLANIQSGGSLSASMAMHPKIFDNLYVNLVKAGEASGKVDEAMEKLADMLDSQLEFKGKIKGAMIYPAIVVVAMVAVAVFMITSIIPKITDVYKQFGAELPLPTMILLGISDIFRNYFILVILAVGAFYGLVKLLKRNVAGEMLVNDAVLHFPVLGALQIEVTLTVINRTLGTLVNAGVAILEALKITAGTMSNNKFKLGIVEASSAVEKGLPLSDAIKRNPNFPLIMAQLTAIGEETGTLGDSLIRVSDFYQASSERKVKALTTALEPLMIILMGVMVGGLAVAVLLPMFNLVNVIK